MPYEQQEQPVDSDQDDESLGSDSSSFDEEQDETQPNQAETELQRRFIEIVDIIDTLDKLSRSFRNPQLRLTKTGSHKEIDPDTGIDLIHEYAEIDLRHTKELITQLRKDTAGSAVQREIWSSDDELLLRRLATALTKRRQQLLYWRKHRTKLGSGAEFTLGERKIEGKAHTFENKELHPRTRSDVLRMIQDPGKGAGEPNLDAPSITSIATTTQGLDGSKIEFPPPPAVKAKNKDFECPYCFAICPARYLSPRAWRFASTITSFNKYHLTLFQDSFITRSPSLCMYISALPTRFSTLS